MSRYYAENLELLDKLICKLALYTSESESIDKLLDNNKKRRRAWTHLDCKSQNMFKRKTKL